MVLCIQLFFYAYIYTHNEVLIIQLYINSYNGLSNIIDQQVNKLFRNKPVVADSKSCLSRTVAVQSDMQYTKRALVQYTKQAQISLRICAGWSGPSLSAYRISGYCSICWQTENPQIRPQCMAVHADLDLCCLQIILGPFSCIAFHMTMFILNLRAPLEILVENNLKFNFVLWRK